MSRSRRSPLILQRSQRGMNLVELMIALVIGLAVVGGLSQVFVSGQQSYSLQDRMGALQENGRYALFFLQRDVRNAGMPANGAVTAFDTTRTLDGGGNASDQVAVTFRAMANGNNCLGNNIIAGELVTTVYSINVDAGTGVSRLMCAATNGGTAGSNATGALAAAQPIVDGIENMQILYGVDVDTDINNVSYGYADLYLPANAVTAAQWGRVVAVRIAVLASSMTPVTGDTANDNTRTFVLLNAPPVGPLQKNFPAPNGPLMGVRGRVFTTTIEVRNRTGAG